MVQSCHLAFRFTTGQQRFQFDHNQSNLAVPPASFLNDQPEFTFRTLQLFAVGNPVHLLHRVPEVDQFEDLAPERRYAL